MAIPIRYSLRNILVRRAAAAFTAIGIALTVAVFAGVLALREGFASVYAPRGSEEMVLFTRPGSQSEGESMIARERAQILMKERPEIVRRDDGQPLAAAESFLAVYMELVTGGDVNVPLRGVQPMSVDLHGDALRIVEGRMLEFGADEVIVGAPLTERMRNSQVGETLMINATPFTVVGVFEHDGVHGGEVWGDVDRMLEALERTGYQRVYAKVVPGTDVGALRTTLADDKRAAVQVQTEREYLAAQTGTLGGALAILAGVLSLIMGVAAILGAVNTMLATVAARTHEIGVLLAIGYPRWSVFVAFLIESAVIGLLGGLLGVLLILPFDGLRTGMMNWQTFTDVSFAFQVTPSLIGISFGLAFMLGLLGGSIPAWYAARLEPVEALRS